ncbi:putative bifunctional diguanylate cyclase/phosphodiesterase [Clostridium oryzae]|uniref:Cyclic di-GMP phosphodiesterase Gmr n=1 Tax=Clostridium oryzae TaxID=1450648 RepID=A0A1V4IZ32_9CLOT|nr:EAL domain-containing protein [Clostridium oryzae]OPJ64657.1 cyclic di-GMP phosphodiesterase Gmr [Clostridium oryzae]
MNYKLSDLVDKQNIIDFFQNLFISTGLNCCIIDSDNKIFIPYKYSKIFSNEISQNLDTLTITLANNENVLSDLECGKKFVCNTYAPELTLLAVPILVSLHNKAVLYCAVDDDFSSRLDLKYSSDINNLINFLISISKILEDSAYKHLKIRKYTKRLSINHNSLAVACRDLISTQKQLMVKLNEITKSQKLLKQNKELSDKVHKMEYYDSLTGLPNKLSLHRTLDSLCKNDEHYSIVFLDLDNFKPINETLGHNCGDSLLKLLSQSLLNNLDENSSVYRWDGDEFIFVLRNITSEIALCKFMDKLIQLLNNPIQVDEHELYVTGSLGGCIYPLHGVSVEEIIRNSDIAMNHAKSLGKNTYQIYNSSFSVRALEQINLDRALRHALKNNEFEVYYQPRIDICKNKLVGMEALIRWVKPDGTIIGPVDFIYKAEESGLIIPIGEFVIRTVCKKIKEWRRKGHDLTVSLNLSPYQINDRNLIKVIKDCILENEIPPSNIEFEITESAAIKDMHHTIELLNELNSLGINVLLDDFGTGYSSLNFLRLLPVSTIKIDKSFIDKVCEESPEKTIVCYLISLAHSISLRVIAEGIENTSQLYFLQDNLCDEAQGYYFSKPVSADEFEALLA